MATIEKTQVRTANMKKLFSKDRFEDQPLVDAWNVTGEINGAPIDVQTRSYERALQYAALIDAQDAEGYDALLRSNQ